MMQFNFPATKFAEENNGFSQAHHVISEAFEAKEALLEGRNDDMLEELADLHHSLETFWRILGKSLGEDHVEMIFERVILKNKKRGYYK